MGMSNPVIPAYRANYGSYTGNDSSDRAITHGLGSAPKHVKVVSSNNSSGFDYVHGSGFMASQSAGLGHNVTAADNTDFHIGGAAATFYGNAAGTTYYWVAIT